MLVVSISCIFILIRWNIGSTGMAVIAGVILFFCLLFVYRQSRISSELNILKSHIAGAPDQDTMSNELLSELKVQFDAEAQQNFLARQKNELFANRFNDLEERIRFLENKQEEATAKSNLIMDSLGPLDDVAKNITDAKLKRPDKTTLQAALKGENLNIHLQPIVKMPSRSPEFFDAFMRLQIGDKEYLDNVEFRKFANDGGLLPVIDSKTLFSSTRILKTLAGLKKQAGLFCTISGKTLSDSNVFPKILQFLKTNKKLKKSLIIGITHGICWQ
jgi:hypothetical protein